MMAAERLNIESEFAYDLLQDNMELILALLETPMSKQELLGRLGSIDMLGRLVRNGLIQEGKDGKIFAVAETYQQVRQEGMMTFLQRYILPSLNAGLSSLHGAESHGLSRVWIKTFRLSPTTIRALRPNQFQSLFEELLKITNVAAQTRLYHQSVLIVGTSRDKKENLSENDSILELVKEASLQKVSGDEKDMAIMSQFDCLADSNRYRLSLDTLERALALLESEETSDTIPYHLTVAIHWRCESPKISVVDEVSESC